jgi:hypothetical protein
MDFYQIKEREGVKKGTLEVYADFKVIRSKDLMVRGTKFYAIWDEVAQLWSTDEFDVVRIVDKELEDYEVKTPGIFEIKRKYLGNFSSNSWLQFRNYVGHLSDSATQLDENLTFSNTEIKKDDYVSRRLPYALAPGNIQAWDEIVGTLYDEEERAKIEWMIGSIVSGDSKHIQKFFVFYGAMGTGKSTILNIIQWMFEGYWTTFNAKELTGANNSFALESFKKNPLLAIEHDGDLSKITDNSKLNSLVSHEPLQVNEKNKPMYSMKFNALLLIGSNNPVKITDAKSGLIRRLIDIQPTGNLMAPKKYQSLMNQVKFELGAIAAHCLDVYLSMGKDYYSGYRPTEMMLQTDVFFNFIEAHYELFKEQGGVTLAQAYELYKVFIEESGIEHKLARYKLREELKNYFEHFEDRAEVDGVRVRSWYSGFNANRFKMPTGKPEDQHMFSLVMDETESLFDKEMAEAPAQYSKDDGTPRKYWTDAVKLDKDGKEFTPKPSQVVNTVLSELNTHKEHYVKVPLSHIVIDFDLKDANGDKSAERNLEAASQWPPTYAEFSKSGAGIHLHYEYDGDVSELSRVYDDGIEVKVFTGDTSLRRMLSTCNNVPVATLTVGSLPLKEKKLINQDTVKSEKNLRDLIQRNLRKEIHPNTSSSVSFIHKILEEAYQSDLEYDVSDMRGKILAFANNSTNQALQSIKLVQTMKFHSDGFERNVIEQPLETRDTVSGEHYKECKCAECTAKKDDRLVFFDVEVFPNLFIVCWKYEDDKDAFGQPKVVRMINPTAQQIEPLLAMKLVGFNCRRYDNHIIYAAYLGYTIPQLYKLSQKIISGAPNALFGEAYNISYTDIYDYASKKQSLKKWEIELGIKHLELGLPWDQEVPKELWEKVAEYCDNDVLATEATHVARKGDYIARQILADLSGLSLNATTQQHASRIVFGDDSKPQSKFVYTDLSTGETYDDPDRHRGPSGKKANVSFPGYVYDLGKSTYRGEITGEGGYVYAEPGIYENVALLDVASMHPTSIEELDLFGEYTKNFSDLKRARIAIKHGDYEEAKQMLGGKLARHLQDPTEAEALSDALKIVINIVYGLTSARFENSFRDPRNIDNIVAKRGALFMIDLKHAVQEKGFTVAHIKTDSIKIPNATKEIIEFVMEFGAGYGYTFEHEATYKKMALVNDAVYVAKVAAGKKPEHWEAVGAQFQHPYVFKKLFTHEPIKFEDKCETKTVTTALYLDFADPDAAMALSEPQLRFVGKAGQFCPIVPGAGGGLLVREKEGKYYAATGTKGYFWLEAEVVKGKKEKDIDESYFTKLTDDAVSQISKYGDFEWFVS